MTIFEMIEKIASSYSEIKWMNTGKLNVFLKKEDLDNNMSKPYRETFRKACKFYNNGFCFHDSRGNVNPLYFKKCNKEDCFWMHQLKDFDYIYTVDEDYGCNEYHKGDMVIVLGKNNIPSDLKYHKTSIEEFIQYVIHSFLMD